MFNFAIQRHNITNTPSLTPESLAVKEKHCARKTKPSDCEEKNIGNIFLQHHKHLLNYNCMC